ncbi:MAG: DsbC family protein [Luteimonas sp.]
MKTILALLLASTSLSACAQDATPATSTQPAIAAAAVAPGTAAARARDALLSIDPKMPVEGITDAPLPGFQQAIVGGQVIYISNDGKYLLQGTLYDVANRLDLGVAAMAAVRVKLLRSIPVSDRIVFAPANPKYTVTVFTDVECGYCRKMHGEIGEYNAQGIAIQYVAFPRMGLASEDFRKMESVWCATDRKQALTDAKNDRPVATRKCTNPVAMQYTLGQRMGLNGTPMVLTADGTQLGGYVPPAQMRAMLDKLAAGSKPVASTATGAP